MIAYFPLFDYISPLMALLSMCVWLLLAKPHMVRGLRFKA